MKNLNWVFHSITNTIFSINRNTQHSHRYSNHLSFQYSISCLTETHTTIITMRHINGRIWNRDNWINSNPLINKSTLFNSSILQSPQFIISKDSLQINNSHFIEITQYSLFTLYRKQKHMEINYFNLIIQNNLNQLISIPLTLSPQTIFILSITHTILFITHLHSLSHHSLNSLYSHPSPLHETIELLSKSPFTLHHLKDSFYLLTYRKLNGVIHRTVSLWLR